MAFEHIDHLKCVVVIAEEDHIALERKASDVRSEFRPGAPKDTRQSGERSALRLKFINKSPADRPVAAFLGDVPQNIPKILACRRQINQPVQSVAFPRKGRFFFIQSLGYIVIVVLAAGLYRRIERRP